jgi:hypothetical protein
MRALHVRLVWNSSSSGPAQPAQDTAVHDSLNP